jgi:hypothetical protein
MPLFVGASESYDTDAWEAYNLKKENAKLRELCADMAKMLVLASWASVESDEEASQCIHRAEALGIEVDG